MIKVTTKYVGIVFTAATNLWVDRRRSQGINCISGATATVFTVNSQLQLPQYNVMPWSAVFVSYPPPAGRRR
ncbi:hypothetical protein KCP77_11995 [Salmonella enterica subsp. enterica]|nr:hypothetical protein KCP77_11995 [Salmonella enterica subsp. enterica]